jgi:hypothetical protein
MGPPAGRDEGWARSGFEPEPALPGEAEPEPDDGPVPRSRRLMRTAWVGAVVAWGLASVRGELAQVAIVLGVTLVLALVARFAYLRVFLGRDWPWRVWSPWLFVVAASLALVGLSGAELRARDDGSERSAADEADWVEGCRSGGIESYDALPATHPTRVTFTREEIEAALERFCATAAERGFASDEAPTPEEQRELDALMQDILADIAGNAA